MYITLEEYSQIYDTMDEKVFKRLCFDACRVMDIHTTGADNVKKLRDFFPTDEYDAAAVKNCAAKIINILKQIQSAEESSAASYEESEMGIRGKYITSISAGNESITYSAASGGSTAVDKAVMDRSQRDKLLADMVREGLSGVTDANGVSLLYMGRYPGGAV